MEKRKKYFWIAGFFLPKIDATVFRSLGLKQFDLLPINNFVQDLGDFFPLVSHESRIDCTQRK